MSCILVCHSSFSQSMENDVCQDRHVRHWPPSYAAPVDIAPYLLVNKVHVIMEAVLTMVCQRGRILCHTFATPKMFFSSLVHTVLCHLSC